MSYDESVQNARRSAVRGGGALGQDTDKMVTPLQQPDKNVHLAERPRETSRMRAATVTPITTQGREARRLSTLLEVSQALSGTLNLKSSLHRVLEVLAKHHGAIRSMVTMLRDGGELFVEASDGLDRPAQAVHYRMGEGITGRVVETSKPVVVP